MYKAVVLVEGINKVCPTEILSLLKLFASFISSTLIPYCLLIPYKVSPDTLFM